MPTNATTAQVEGKFAIELEVFSKESQFEADSVEVFPMRESISLNLSGNDHGESLSIAMAPRAALDLAKKLMAMCADYTEDVGACDPCGELFPTEELHDVDTTFGAATLCTVCMESGR